MRPMKAVEAQELLFNYMKILNKEKFLKMTPDPAYAKAAKEALIIMSKDLYGSFDSFNINIQRHVYEAVMHAQNLLMLFEDEKPLPELVHDSMTDDEKLSLLLRNGIVKMIDGLPGSH